VEGGEAGEIGAEERAKGIYQTIAERAESRWRVKPVASVDRIARFLPTGGSKVKG